MKAKKSLGQNFLKSTAVVSRIAKTADIKEGEIVLEIGPGKGVLTRGLLNLGAKVIAVEKDDALIPYLEEKFSAEIAEDKLKIIHGDILSLSASEILDENEKYKICANIPYYITGEIIRKFLEEKKQPSSMTLLVQKEVGKRIAASDDKESILSLSVKIYGIPKYIETVKKSMFAPSPKVDSAVLHISNINKEQLIQNNISSEKFFDIIRAGFAHKRKKLGGNLKNLISKENLENFKDKRAEDLSLSNWIDLAKL